MREFILFSLHAYGVTTITVQNCEQKDPSTFTNCLVLIHHPITQESNYLHLLSALFTCADGLTRLLLNNPQNKAPFIETNSVTN